MTNIKNKEAIKNWSSPPRGMVENFGEEGDFTRQKLLNPTLLSLLGNVNGKEILDAGCGQGYLCRMLSKKGAVVTGIEPASVWFSYAQQKEESERLGIKYIQNDLSTWTPSSETYDYVIANMVFMDIPDYLSALKNCVDALKKSGILIFSLLHPCFEESGASWASKGFVEVRNYFEERDIKQSFGFYIHRTLSTYINSVIQVNCTIQKVIEPKLDEIVAKQHRAERYAEIPGYIVISAKKN